MNMDQFTDEKHNSSKKDFRKQEVLEHIVSSYISTAIPVSSKCVSEIMAESLSSATIRNIMAELEDEGFIVQPHTSAGRIPTETGYRCYVDMIKDRIKLERKEAERLAAEYDLRIETIKEIIETTSYLISKELHNAAIVMWPGVEDFYIKHLELVKVKAETIFAVLVTVTNAVQNYILRLDTELGKDELAIISNYINSNYEFKSLPGIRDEIREDIAGSRDDRRNIDAGSIAGKALSIIDGIIAQNIENDICCDGLDIMMDEPEFRETKAAKGILGLFSSVKKSLAHLLKSELPSSEIMTYIGTENGFSVLKDYSVVTCGYTLHGKTLGRMGVIGSTRMDYSRAFRLMKYLSGIIDNKLTEMVE